MRLSTFTSTCRARRSGGARTLSKLFARVAGLRRPSFVVRPGVARVDASALSARLIELGPAGESARRLDAAVDALMEQVMALSSLTSVLALDYIDRLARPVPEMTPEMGVQIVTRSYVAHLAVESEPSAYGAVDIPVLGTLPPLKRGAPPQDLLSRVVKASRRGFEVIRALPEPVWEGWIAALTRRVHDAADDDRLLAPDVIDGLARFGWVLRQVDIHYQQEPERG